MFPPTVKAAACAHCVCRSSRASGSSEVDGCSATFEPRAPNPACSGNPPRDNKALVCIACLHPALQFSVAWISKVFHSWFCSSRSAATTAGLVRLCDRPHAVSFTRSQPYLITLGSTHLIEKYRCVTFHVLAVVRFKWSLLPARHVRQFWTF